MNPKELEKLIDELDRKIADKIGVVKRLEDSLAANAEQFEKLANDLTEANKNDVTKKLLDSFDKMSNSKNELFNDLTQLEKELSNKISSVTDATKKTQMENVIKSLSDVNKTIINKITSNLDATRKALEKDTSGNINIQNIRNNQQQQTAISGGNMRVDVNESKEELTTAQNKLKDINKDGIDELFKSMLKGDNAIGGSVLLVGLLWNFKKVLKNLGIDTSSILSATGTALTAPFGELLGTIKNVTKIIEGYVLQIKAIVNVVTGLGKSLIAVPLRIMDYASEEGHKIKKENVELFNQLERMQESFRQTSTIGRNVVAMNQQLRGRRVSYLDPNNPAARLYGAQGDQLIARQMEESANILKSMGPRAELMAKAVTKNVTAADSSIANYYYKAKKLMNLSEDDMGKLTNMAISLGKSFPEVFDEISTSTANVAKRFSLDFKMMSTDVLTLRKDIVNFGHKSADELALVAGHIRQMGISMSDAMAVFNKFQTFEDAATTAAQLSQTFGMVVDSMELLKAQSPDEILQQYKDAFIASGKSFETMDRFSKSLILQQTGLSDQAAQALFSAENAGKTYEEIMSEIEAKDPTKQQAKNMQEMRDAIVELKDTLTQDFKSFFEAMQEGFTKKLFANPTIRKSMEKMALAMDNIFLKFTRMDLKRFEPLIARMTAWIDKLSTFLTSREFLTQLENVAYAIGDIVDGFTGGGQEKMQKGLTSLLENIKPIYSFLAGIGAEIIKNTAVALLESAPTIISTINGLLDDISNGFDALFSDNADANKNSSLRKFLGNMFNEETKERILNSLTDLTKKVFGDQEGDKKGLIGRIKDLYVKLFDGEEGLAKKITNAFRDGFTSIIKDPAVLKAISEMGSITLSGILTNLPIDDIMNRFVGAATNAAGNQVTNAGSSLLNAVSFGYLGKSAEERAQEADVAKKNTNAVTPTQTTAPTINPIQPTPVITEQNKTDIATTVANSLIGAENTEKLKKILSEAMLSALTTYNTTAPNSQAAINLNIDGRKIGEAIINAGFTSLLVDPNITKNTPSLNPSALNYSNAQIPANKFA